MRILGTKKRFAAVATTTAAVLIGSGVAVAFWTTGGSGSGTANVEDPNDVTYSVSATDGIDDLYPGANEVFEVVAANGNAADLDVTTVAVAIDGFAAPAPGCNIADFDVTSPIAFNSTIPGGATAHLIGTATISMDNTASNQDACKGAQLDLSFTS